MMIRTRLRSRALLAAIESARLAPSVFNTQPWRWHIAGDTAELYFDGDRRLRVVDPLGRLMTVSCGVALHHARVALAAAGYGVLVERWPVGEERGPVARLHLLLDHEPTAEECEMSAAIPQRRTDRRPFGDQPVSLAVRDRLTAAAVHEGTTCFLLRPHELPAFAVAVARAADVETADAEYLSELIRWTNRPPWSGDGVPPSTAVQTAGRPVPPREFAFGGQRGLWPGDGTDRGALFAVLAASQDDEVGWLRGGEALSAVLLTATAEGLSTAPISDVIEVTSTRTAVRRMLGTQKYPFVALRAGHGLSTEDIPPVPRRPADEVVQGDRSLRRMW